MKPLPFDMTPFAEAIEMPTITQETKPMPAATESPKPISQIRTISPFPSK